MSVTRSDAEAAVRKHGSKSAAARALGVSRNALRYALARAVVKSKSTPALDAVHAELVAERRRKTASLPRPKKRPKITGAITRVIIPDSHGAHIHWPAADAMVADIRELSPDEVVWIGDHLDCGGTFSSHQRSYTRELAYSYSDDVTQANRLLDLVQQAAPNARHHYLEGNHEQHVERWAVRNIHGVDDVRMMLGLIGPYAALRLKERGFNYYRMSETHHSLTTPGMIRLGKCHFSHGWRFSEHATAAMVKDAGVNLVHGHTHRASMYVRSSTDSYMHAGWCFGTLAQLSPLYRHNSPSNWTHGYGVQFVNAGTGTFTTIPVPIFGDSTMLLQLKGRI